MDVTKEQKPIIFDESHLTSGSARNYDVPLLPPRLAVERADPSVVRVPREIRKRSRRVPLFERFAG